MARASWRGQAIKIASTNFPEWRAYAYFTELPARARILDVERTEPELGDKGDGR